MRIESVAVRNVTRQLFALACLTLVAVPNAEAIDGSNLISQGFAQRYRDRLNVYVSDLFQRSYLVKPDGSAKHTIYGHHTTLGSDGQPKVERFAQYVVVTDASNKVVKVIDQFDIPHVGSDLTHSDDDVSFIDHQDCQVTIRPNGSCRVLNNRGKGAGFEIYYMGRLRERFDSQGKTTHRYGYDRVVQGEGAFTTEQIELKEFVGVNSRGSLEHWGKTATDKATGKQTWMLQNGIDGETMPLRGVHRITDAKGSSIVIEHSTVPAAPGNEQLVASKTTHKLDGAKIETKTFKKPDGTIRESIAVFGNEEKPAYLMEVTVTMESGERKVRSMAIDAGNRPFTSKNGKLWVQAPTKDQKAKYFLGDLKVLDDGSYYQDGFETDARGERLKIEGKLAPVRHFLIDTSGLSEEIVSHGNETNHARAKIVRDRAGDVLQTVDVHGRATSFQYSPDRDKDNKRLVRVLNDAGGNVWKSDDNGLRWYQPESGKERDASETMTMQIDRVTGAVTYEGWTEITTVSLDGTTHVKDKDSESARVYNGDGQIISTTNDQGEETTFTYNPDRTLKGFETRAAAVQPKQREKIRVLSVDWNGTATFLREFASNQMEKYVHFKDGTIKVFGHQGELLSISHLLGLQCEYEYRRKELVAMKRTTRNGVQLFHHDKNGKPKIVAIERDGAKTRKSEFALAGFQLADDGKLILDYGRHQDAEAPRSQTFYPDGTRRVLRQDLSTWNYDKADRLARYGRGISEMFIVADYQGDRYVPIRIDSRTGTWTRAKLPLRAADDGILVFEWSFGWTDDSKKQKWTGPVDLSGFRFQLPGEEGVAINALGEYREYVFVDNDASFTKNKAEQIRESVDAQGEHFIYERDKEGAVERALLVTGKGDEINIEKVFSISSGVARVTINEQTGQPTFVGSDGMETIHEVNGVVLTRNKEGQIVRLAVPKGETFSVTQESNAEAVSRIDRDADSGNVTIAFKNGDSAWFDREGAMIVTNKDQQLIRSVDRYSGNSFEYRYDEAGELASITQKVTSNDHEGDKVRVVERSGGSNKRLWRTRGEEIPGEPFETLLIDSKTGKQVRLLNNGSVLKVGPDGDANETTLDESEVRSIVRRSASGKVIDIMDSRENTVSYFGNQAGEVIHIVTGVESATRASESLWGSSFDGDKQRIAQFSFDDKGNQMWKNKDVTLTRYPDGSRRIQLADGSATHHSADRSEIRTTPASGGDVEEVITDIQGFKTVVFRDGGRHIQHPNEFAVRREDAQGKQIGTFQGLIRVSDFGTVTQIDLEKNTATVFHRNGSPTKIFQRNVAEDGAEIHYFDGRKLVDLSDFDAKEPRSIAPQFGFNSLKGESVIWADLAYVGRLDAHTPKRAEGASVAKKTVPGIVSRN